MPVATDIRLSIVIPEAVFNKYGSEEEIARRLAACQDHDSKSPLYIDDASRNTLSQILGRLIRTPNELISLLRQKHEIKVAKVSIPLEEQLLNRLETRRFGLTLEELIRKQVVEGLETFVGMR